MHVLAGDAFSQAAACDSLENAVRNCLPCFSACSTWVHQTVCIRSLFGVSGRTESQTSTVEKCNFEHVRHKAQNTMPGEHCHLCWEHLVCSTCSLGGIVSSVGALLRDDLVPFCRSRALRHHNIPSLGLPTCSGRTFGTGATEQQEHRSVEHGLLLDCSKRSRRM